MAMAMAMNMDTDTDTDTDMGLSSLISIVHSSTTNRTRRCEDTSRLCKPPILLV